MKKSTPWLLMLLTIVVSVIILLEQRHEIVEKDKYIVTQEQRYDHNYKEFIRELDEVIAEAAKSQRALDKCRRVR